MPVATLCRVAKRVLILTKSMGPGGAERLIVNGVLHGGEQFEYQVAYVLSSEDHLAGELVAKGVPVHDLGARHDYDFAWLSRLRSLMRRERFDLVHSHLPYAASWGRLVARTLPRHERPKLVYTQHTPVAVTPLPVRLFNQATMGLDDLVITVSEDVRASLPRGARHRAEVVHHGIDPPATGTRDEQQALRQELGIGEDLVLSLTVANLRAQKGYDVLLEAARLVIDRGVPIVFLAAGSGPQASELNQLHERSGLGQAFRFLGHSTRVALLLGAADLFVLPSYDEGLPLALMEAMAAGKAIISTAVGGVPELIVDGVNGLLVPPGQPEALAEAIASAACDPGQRASLGVAASVAAASLDAGATTAHIEGRYRALLGLP